MSAGPLSAILTIEFTGYWIAGEGKGGAGLDDVSYRDAQGCPAMPMTQIKGQLRETAGRLWSAQEVDALFGNGVAERDDGRSPLAFRGEARLPRPVRGWFASQPETLKQLFRTIASTRITSGGVAADRTLRRIEVAVPMRLDGTVFWRGPREPREDWVWRLDQVCAATLAFGKGKNDGLGRALARCTIPGAEGSEP
ncbi:MAG: hypothetical protein ACREFK_01115 [Stellaceae bacterium]